MNPLEPTGRTIGILALQGDYDAHRKALEERLGAATLFVRGPRDLATADALILPGGESTTIVKLLERIGLVEPIRERAAAGMPVYGTCAGMILMARDVEDRPGQPTLALLDITASRNAFGRQVDSFEAEIPLSIGEQQQSVRGVFIRAPYASRVGPGVNVIATYRGRTVGVQSGRLLATAFHPELTDDTALHAYFLGMVCGEESNR